MLIVDPLTYSKQVAYDEALVIVKQFLDLNNIAHPSSFNVFNSFPRMGKLKTDYGFYEFRDRSININLKKSRTPVKNPGFQWSFTGSTADLTAPGILCHEVGHHIHSENGDRYYKNSGYVHKFFVHVQNEASVSGYEPNLYEAFAETMRLFILNPDLLKLGRPLRFGYFVDELKLQPLHEIPWKEILINAHPRLVSAVENWIIKGNIGKKI